MNISTHSSKLKITDDLLDYALKKIGTLDKFLEKHTGEVFCDIELGKTSERHKSGDIFLAEVTIKHPGMKQLFAHAVGPDLRVAIDRVKDEMEHEILSVTKKKKSLSKKTNARMKKSLKGM